MAYDKVIDSAQLDAAITATADKIRAGTGSADKIKWDESKGFADAIPSSVEQAVPSISVSNGGLITASVEQGAGVVKNGTKSATKQLSVQAATTVTPGTSEKTAVSSGKYTIGAVKVKGDTNLKAANIAKGVSIFGVTGTHEGSGGAKVATGTVTISNNGILNSTVTVSGLGFKPTFIIMYLSPDVLNQENSASDYGYTYWDDKALYTVYADGKTSTVCPELGEEENYDEDNDEYYYYEFAAASVAGNLTLTPTNDGFTISAINGICFWEHPAQYIAIS